MHADDARQPSAWEQSIAEHMERPYSGFFGRRDFHNGLYSQLYSVECRWCRVVYLIPSETITCSEAIDSFVRSGWRIEDGRVTCGTCITRLSSAR